MFEIIKKIRAILKNNDGQLLPFIAVLIIILILFTAVQFGLSVVYLSRSKIKDAVDSAVLSAASVASVEQSPTYYGERYKKKKNGGGKWVKTTKNWKNYIYLTNSDAKQIAEEYLVKNLKVSNLKGYKVLDFKIKINQDYNPVQVHKDRPHTEGIIETWERNYPRWVSVDATARIEVPAPMGGIVDHEKMTITIHSQSKKNLNKLKADSSWQ